MQLQIFLYSLVTLLGGGCASTVYNVVPNYGSSWGGVRITIYGQGFAANQFNFGPGNENLGNRVLLVSTTRSYECDIHKDGCTLNQIMCYTRPMEVDTYYPKVFVDGNHIPDCTSGSCAFALHDAYTPHLSSVTPLSGTPHTLLRLTGKLMTSRYGSNVAESTNGRTEKILRVYVGGDQCELIQDFVNSTPYGIALDANGASENGHMDCLMMGSYVGHINASFLIEAPYGRSFPDLGVLRIWASNKIAMFQTYAEVTSIAPSSGSLKGGTKVTILGRYFDATEAPLDVQIGGSPCDVNVFDDNRIVCTTRAQSPPTPMFTGGRGFDQLVWNFTTSNLNDASGLINRSHSVSHLDALSFGYACPVTTLSKGLLVVPSSGKYQLLVQASSRNYKGRVLLSPNTNPDDKVEIINGQNDARYSLQQELVAGVEYYLEIWHSCAGPGTTDLIVSLLMYNTDKTETQTGYALNEQQQLVMFSDIIPEEQRISFASWNARGQSAVNEIQIVDVELNVAGYSTDFRLGMDSLHTGWMPTGSSGEVIAAALNGLPTISPDTVEVSVEELPSGLRYVVTFSSERGSWSLLTSAAREEESVKITISRDTEGVPSMKVAVVEFDGVPTRPFPIDAPATIQAAFEELFSVRCSPVFSSVTNTFEAYANGAYLSHINGIVVADQIPFCGKKSVVISDSSLILYDGDDVSAKPANSFPYACFAYRGALSDAMWLYYSYIQDGQRQYSWQQIFFSQMEPERAAPINDYEWHYKCIDLKSRIVEMTPNGLYFSILRLYIYVTQWPQKMYIDNLYFGPTLTTEYDTEKTRLLPPRGYLMNDVQVLTTSPSEYSIRLYPVNCTHEFSMMTVRNGPSSVSRISGASPPVTGTFDLSYNNSTITGIEASVAADKLKLLLETLPGMGCMSVQKYGLCHSYSWVAKWLQVGGDRPTVQLDTTNIQGINAGIRVQTNIDGYARFSPIMGDFLSTASPTPQVVVRVNNVPSICAGSCEFLFDSAATPTILELSPTSGPGHVVLKINGTGFAAENIVTVGDSACTNVSIENGTLSCHIHLRSRGRYPVKLVADGYGKADGSLFYEFVSVISEIKPSYGHLSGGYEITLTGSGLLGARPSHSEGDCSVIFSNDTFISCLMSPSNTPGETNLTLHFEDGTTMGIEGFYFNNSVSASSVWNISTDSVSVLGGTSLTIFGSGFGEIPRSVMVGHGNQANITSWTNDTITVILPSLAKGSYPLLVVVDDGYADCSTSSVGPIVYTLLVTDLSPRVTSVFGGVKHEISGYGFGTTPSLVNVMVGPLRCDVDSVTDDTITCTTRTASQIFQIDNSGTDPTYGQYYAWNPSSLVVEVGDYVEWRWTSPSGVSGIGYLVQQTEGIDSNQAKANGFSSGLAKSSSGFYRYQFTETGTFFFWSGPVNVQGSVILRGRIQVDPKAPFKGDLIVTVADQTADVHLETQGGHSAGRRDVTCVPEEFTYNIPDNVTFDVSSSPEPAVTVTDISPANGTSQDVITISGSGFSSQDCNNLISFGGILCDIISSSNSTVTCLLSDAQSVPIGVILPLSFFTNNLGEAAISLTGEARKGFVLLPRIASLSFHSGSLRGGQLLTINGDGFQYGDLTVMVGFSRCTVQDITASNLTCITSPSQAWSGDIAVTVTSPQGGALQAVCSGDCSYSYGETSTPVLTSVSPTQVSEPGTVLMLSGEWFGNDSEIIVHVGNQFCDIVDISDTEINCTLGALPAGVLNLSVRTSMGLSSGSPKALTSVAALTSLSPSSGSTQGGLTVTITGNGFSSPLSVTMGGLQCQVTTLNATQVECVTPAHSAGQVPVLVSLGVGFTFPASTFTFSAQNTPSLTAVIPTSAVSGETITITGTSLEPLESVMIDGSICAVTASNATTISCVLGDHSAGSFPINALVQGKGYAVPVTFTFTLGVKRISPAAGSFGGGQLVTIEGMGFDNTVLVQICNKTCENQAVNSSQITCLTPPADNSAGSDLQCDVRVSLLSESVTLPSNYSYSLALGGHVNAILPARGGTGGGTLLTITGSGFDADNTSVTIDGIACAETFRNGSTLVCETGAHRGTGHFDVKVMLGSNGLATSSVQFYYIDVWSSVFTWGGGPLPEEGDLVVIGPGQNILLDVDTPVLKVLLIQGSLVFDEVDVELQSENILILDGGVLQVGTETEPFQHNAIITLHGHQRSLEMPIYGAKTLAVRNGTLDLHGKPRIPWTRLSTTVNAGSNEISLENPVDWEVGNHIVIASTGLHDSQSQNEEHVIIQVSNDGRTLTLNNSLAFDHLGVTVNFSGGYSLDMKAEVGLLSHNVVVRGSINHEWDETIPACPAGFDTGEFAVQTCFQGKFGAEMGSDQFGAAIMMHGTVKNSQSVIAKLSHIEVTHAGQAFRLGRYPIHFHLNGNMSQSYVRGCSIHRTFNRAINVHNSHNVLIEHNVVYNVMGGAIFLEDSAETGNILQYNLAVFVVPSTSLLNDDITPAAFWVTHPSNIVRHNHAAGGSHFGFWYRMLDHPQGPSADLSLCPKNAPLGEFSNNTAHSQGWFGLWTFDEYYPMDGNGVCAQSRNPIPAVFKTLTAWHCEKGAEFVFAGNVQFDGFFMVNNKVTGIEGKKNSHHTLFSYDGPMIKNSVIIADDGLGSPYSSRGIILPFSQGFLVSNVTFVDFNIGDSYALAVTSIQGKTAENCGGWTYKFEGIQWVQTTNKAAFRWEHEAALEDLDGSLCGVSGAKVVPYNPTLDPSICSHANEWSNGISASICYTSRPFHRFAWNDIYPSSINFKNALLSNEFGTSITPWRFKRLTHPKGWMVMLMGGGTYDLTYQDATWFANVSYTGSYYGFNVEDYVIIRQHLYQRPDRFQIINGVMNNGSEQPLSYENNVHGDWYIDKNLTFSFIVSGKDSRSKRAVGLPGVDRPISFQTYRCYFRDCIPPPDPNTTPPPLTRPGGAIFWSGDSSWENAEVGWGGNNGDGTFSPPKANTDVKIYNGDWMVLDTQPAVLNKLYLYGVLEFEPDPINGAYMDFTLSVTHILIFGGRLFVGWENKPMRGNVEIILRGDRHTQEVYLPFGGPTVGAKCIGVFGSLDMHGLPHNITWTRLALSASAGDSHIQLTDAVDWQVGDEIVISTSGKSPWKTETRKLTAVSADGVVLTLNATLQFDHSGLAYTSGNYAYTMAAEVGLLTRNVKVIGEDYNNLYPEAFGARVLVGTFFDGLKQWVGSARVENVEFYHTGQEGYTEYDDPRFSLAYLDTGSVSNIKPSYIRGNSFHEGFITSIGIIGATGVVVENNVIQSTVGPGIRVKSLGGVTLNHNLVTLAQARACFLDRMETTNFEAHGAIEIYDAQNVTLTDNAVAGSERIGIAVAGIPCSADSSIWSGNVVHGAMTGVGILPTYTAVPSPCTKISGFTIYETNDFGVYVQSASSLELENLILVDNAVGVLPLVFSPPSLSHIKEDKYVHLSNSLLVGSTIGRLCNDDFIPGDGCSVSTSSQARSWTSPTGGSIGMAFGQFMSGGNGAPRKPWKGLMSYNAIGGLTRIQGVVFENFGVKCTGKRDYAISTSPSNDDGQHPVQISGITFSNVDDESKFFFHRPNLDKINSADCVDMDCDAFKKCMIKDIDGSFLGLSAGATALPQSEWEWNGDPRRGLGDYRIPTTLLTRMNGSRIPVNSIAPYKGIIGNRECSWKDSWTAYLCPPTRNYEMLIIESMDDDTETRRLSPVAILGDKYIDLINGPQDHGWCFGYTCRKRVSTFMALVATGSHYALYFTSTSPQALRLTLLNAADDKRISLEIYYSISNRIDAYVNGSLITPLNAYTDNGNTQYHVPDYPCQYCPTANNSNGDNFQDRWQQLFYVTVTGKAPVDIKMSNMIMLTFGVVMSEDQFFGAQIVNNLAIFFGIPSSKIRIVNIVSESSAKTGRRRRATTPQALTIQVEIGDQATVSVDSTVTSGMTTAELNTLRNTIIDAVQTGALADSTGISFTSFTVSLPLPTINVTVQDPANNGTDAGPDVVTPAPVPQVADKVYIPSNLSMFAQPVEATESFSLDLVSVRLITSANETVSSFGSVNWTVTVELKGGDPAAVLNGTLTAPLINGFADFDDLIISSKGSNYILEFHVSNPIGMSRLRIATRPISIKQRMLAANIVAQPSAAYASVPFGIVVLISDLIGPISVGLDWKGLEFMANATLNPIVDYQGADLGSASTQLFNPATGRAVLSLTLVQRRMYVIDIIISSSPDNSYGSYLVSYPILVSPAGYIAPVVQSTDHLTVTFDGSLSSDQVIYFQTSFYNALLDLNCNLSYTQVTCTSANGIQCSASLSGLQSELNNTAPKSLSLMFNSNNYSATTISKDGVALLTSTTTTVTIPVAPTEESFAIWKIIVIAFVGGVILIALFAVIVTCIKKKHSNMTKVSQFSHNSEAYDPEYSGVPPSSTVIPPLEPNPEKSDGKTYDARTKRQIEDLYQQNEPVMELKPVQADTPQSGRHAW